MSDDKKNNLPKNNKHGFDTKSIPNHKHGFDPKMLKTNSGFKPTKGFGKPMARKTGRGR
jgi:hypothetical protein